MRKCRFQIIALEGEVRFSCNIFDRIVTPFRVIRPGFDFLDLASTPEGLKIFDQDEDDPFTEVVLIRLDLKSQFGNL